MTKKIFFTLFIVLISYLAGVAQNSTVVTSSADFVDTVFYSQNNKKAYIHVFNSDEDKNVTQGNLLANSVDVADFNWAKYDTINKVFVPLSNETSVTTSSINNLEEGGYQVIVHHSSGSIDTTFAWIFINNFGADLTNENSKGELNRDSYTCDYFELIIKAPVDTFVYYDIYDSSRITLQLRVPQSSWEVITDDTDFTGIKSNRLDFQVRTKLTEFAEIYMTVTDRYGAKGYDTVTYKPIQVRAKMETEELFINDTDDEFYSKYYNENKASAPHSVRFESLSSTNVDSLYWKFDDDSTSFGFGFDTIQHIYKYPGSYKPILVVENTKNGCIDSTTLSEALEVEEYDFQMPNILVINERNIYRSYDVSVTDFNIIIVSRTGQKVHKFNGDIRDWKGWDGKIKGTNQYVKPGVYYYVIDYMSGWDDNEDGTPVKAGIGRSVRRGFIHVYHDLK